ncbi:hypothetical protein O3M35_010787 [Rhynocoris fuscipes]|uniref:Uncharacterized protein n=1 Tax=Rhynocoris fuscipes TaxID=488301 RepID=A0AAW1D0D1_9HEMI
MRPDRESPDGGAAQLYWDDSYTASLSVQKGYNDTVVKTTGPELDCHNLFLFMLHERITLKICTSANSNRLQPRSSKDLKRKSDIVEAWIHSIRLRLLGVLYGQQQWPKKAYWGKTHVRPNLQDVGNYLIIRDGARQQGERDI